MPSFFQAKRTFRWLSLFSLLAVTFLVVFDSPPSLAQTSPASTGCTSGSGFSLSAHELSLISQLQQAVGGKATISCHAATGKVRFFSSPAGQAISAPASLSANATQEQVARAFLDQYGPLFGIQNQASELKVANTLTDTPGKTFLRFQQLYQQIPVMGGEIIVQLNQARQTLSVGGELTPTPGISVTPLVSADAAQATTLNQLAKEYKLAKNSLTASSPELWIYDSRLLDGSKKYPHSLVWRLEVTNSDLNQPLRELVLVDAQTGKLLLHFNQIADAKQRFVCNQQNNVSSEQDCTAAKAVRTEGGPATGIADIDLAYQYAGITYDFYLNNFGRDSLNGQGLPLKSTVKYCSSANSCPLKNAFWNGSQMYYGDGFASADDVVGHELTHGFTQFTSGLFYYSQSGAINESLSDTFGELIDLSDGVDGYAGNGANVRWLIGEDLPAGVFYPGAPNGALRSMKDPTVYENPDRITSQYYSGGYTDNGGVHNNSGVNNKAVYLMTDGTVNEPGGAFNGKVIRGLGISKVAHIYYELETHLLTSGSDYQMLYDYLQQACQNLTGSYSITAADCQEVKKVVDATEMNLTPPEAPTVKAPVCDNGIVPQNLFYDNLENTASGNWAKQTGSGTNEWFYPGQTNPYGVGPYTTSGQTNFWANDQDTAADFSISMQHSVTLPANAYMHFNHAYDFEWDGFSTGYDGALVEYSTNNGASWQDAGNLFTNNSGYNGTLNSDTNPLTGRDVFTGLSNGYGSSRLDLSSLAGQTVRFRFRVGTDTGNAPFDSGDSLYGWFIDDIAIYTCPVPTVPTTTTLTSSSPTANPGQNVTFTANVTANGGNGIPGGQVIFKDGTTQLNTATLNGAGQATFSTSSLASGNHAITAVYQGASGFSVSTSNTVSQVIQPAGCANPLQVTTAGDDGTCGTFRLAVGTANNNPASPAQGKVVDLSSLPAGTVIQLTAAQGGGVNVGPGVTITRACGASGPDITIKAGTGVTGDGLILNGAHLTGVWVRLFPGRQVVANGKGNVLSCVRATHS